MTDESLLSFCLFVCSNGLLFLYFVAVSCACRPVCMFENLVKSNWLACLFLFVLLLFLEGVADGSLLSFGLFVCSNGLLFLYLLVVCSMLLLLLSSCLLVAFFISFLQTELACLMFENCFKSNWLAGLFLFVSFFDFFTRSGRWILAFFLFICLFKWIVVFVFC